MTYLSLGLSPHCNFILSSSHCASFSSKRKATRADFLFLNQQQKTVFSCTKTQNTERAVRNLSTLTLNQAINVLVPNAANNLYAARTNPQLFSSNLPTHYNEANLLVISKNQPQNLQPITENLENSTVFEANFSVPVVHQLPSLTNFYGKNSHLTTAKPHFSVPVVHQQLSLTNFYRKSKDTTSPTSLLKAANSVPVVHQQNL